MAEPKPFASLSSGLLARKGAAKPAMRPQGFGQMNMGVGLEDLGWNDMGHAPHAPAPDYARDDLPEHVPSSIAALTPAPRPNVELVREEEAPAEPVEEAADVVGDIVDDTSEEIAPPPVVEQQRAIEATFAEPAARKPAKTERAAPRGAVVPLPPRERSPRGSKAKAAFTLRLDADRHLKLRLACAVINRSAQHIVTEALDQYLASLPEVDAISSSVARQAGKRN